MNIAKAKAFIASSYRSVRAFFTNAPQENAMTLIIILKFFHYLSLFLAGGLGVANAMLFKNHQKAGTRAGTTSPQNNDDIGQTWSHRHHYIMGNGDRPDPQNLWQLCFGVGISSKTVRRDGIAWRGGFFEPACDATGQRPATHQAPK